MNTSTAAIDADITVLDYETTGSVNGWAVEPWQLGMVTLKRGRVDPDSLFDSYFKVDSARPFNPHAPGRHAQLRNELAAAPTPRELWPRIRSRLTGGPLCAHNTATEKKFLLEMAPMHRFGPWIDTLRIARKVWPDLASYALEDLIRVLGLSDSVQVFCAGRAPHDALYDAVASAVLLAHLLQQPGWERVGIGELTSL